MTKARSDKVKLRLVEHLRKVPIIQIACERLGLSRATFYRWKKGDPVFAQQVDEAIFSGEQLVNDMAESQLLSAIKDKNLTAIIFWLKHHHRAYATKVELRGDLNHKIQALTPQQELLISKAISLTSHLVSVDLVENVPDEKEPKNTD